VTVGQALQEAGQFLTIHVVEQVCYELLVLFRLVDTESDEPRLEEETIERLKIVLRIKDRFRHRFESGTRSE